MANPSVISYMQWGVESTFGTEASSITLPFGQGHRLTTLTGRNNIEKVWQMGARNAQVLAEKQFEGAYTAEFTLASPWFLQLLLNTTGSTGAGPFNHTFDESDTIPSFTLENGISTDTATVRKLLGAKVATAVLTAAVGELSRVRLDGLYSTETKGTVLSTQAVESFDLFTFAQANFEFPNGTVISDVQNVEVTVEQNLEFVYGLGSRFAQQGPVKNRSYTARVGKTFEDSTEFLETFYGASGGPSATVAETATMELVWDNGLSGTLQRQISLLFTGAKIDEDSMPQDPTALINEDIPIQLRSLAAVGVNNTATIPTG